jgi:hypothetical protein
MNGRRDVWDERWESRLPTYGPVSTAADFFAQIAWEAFPEMQVTGYVPVSSTSWSPPARC